jgi:hypothetical protein
METRIHMNSICRALIAAAALAALSSSASATLLTTTGQITSLRIEAGAGFIGFSPNWQPAGTCGTRVWVDMSSPIGRAVYATALSALNAKQTVTIRADDASQRMFGECNLYDIDLYAAP